MDSQQDRIIKYLYLLEEKLTELYGNAYKDTLKIKDIRSAIETSDKKFSFDKNPVLQKRIDNIHNELMQRVNLLIRTGMSFAWKLGSENTGINLINSLGGTKSKDKQLKEVISTAEKDHRANATSASALSNNKRGGLNLSQRVWNLKDASKNEIESIIQNGIKEGKSSDAISKSVTKYLNNPEDIIKGKPGQGVYRSAYKNAMRLLRTEVNRAYRRAEWESYQSDPLIVGYKVVLSNNHTTTINGKKVQLVDICDDLQGEYPKTFLFEGWHPQCRCAMIPVIISSKEFGEYTRLKNEGKADKFKSDREVKEVPSNFTDWLNKNKDRINAAKEKGTLPYWMQDNKDFINVSNVSFTVINSHGVRDAINAIKDIEKINNEDIKNILLSFSKDNPSLFSGGLKDVVFTAKESEYMSNGRLYRNFTNDRIYEAGNTLNITNRNVFGFNPSAELKNALITIKQGKDLTFKQEYAVECVWHEFLHAKAKGWVNISKKTNKLTAAMEVVNQFCARRSYQSFLEALGGKSINSEQIIAKGLGYQQQLSNLNLMLEKLKIDKLKLYDFLSEKVIKTPYENIRKELIEYLNKESGLPATKLNSLIDHLDIPEYKYISILRKLEPAK